RLGAGTRRQILNASSAASITRSTSAGVAVRIVARVPPSMGERTVSAGPLVGIQSAPAAAPLRSSVLSPSRSSAFAWLPPLALLGDRRVFRLDIVGVLRMAGVCSNP